MVRASTENLRTLLAFMDVQNFSRGAGMGLLVEVDVPASQSHPTVNLLGLNLKSGS